MLLVREHNRLARGMAALNPHWDDERLFQEVRHVLAALMQHISYKEFLPKLLGKRALRQNKLQLLDTGYRWGAKHFLEIVARYGVVPPPFLNFITVFS